MTITFHRSTTPVDLYAPLEELLDKALINHLTGHTEAGLYYEDLAKHHPQYTEQALWGTLAGLAKRQLRLREDLDGALRTLQRGLPAGLRHSVTGNVITTMMIFAFQHEMTHKRLSAGIYKIAQLLVR